MYISSSVAEYKSRERFLPITLTMMTRLATVTVNASWPALVVLDRKSIWLNMTDPISAMYVVVLVLYLINYIFIFLFTHIIV